MSFSHQRLEHEKLTYSEKKVAKDSLAEHALSMLDTQSPLLAFTLNQFIIEKTNDIATSIFEKKTEPKIEDVLEKISQFFDDLFSATNNKQKRNEPRIDTLRPFRIALLQLTFEILKNNFNTIAHSTKNSQEAVPVQKLDIRSNKYEIIAQRVIEASFMETEKDIPILDDQGEVVFAREAMSA